MLKTKTATTRAAANFAHAQCPHWHASPYYDFKPIASIWRLWNDESIHLLGVCCLKL